MSRSFGKVSKKNEKREVKNKRMCEFCRRRRCPCSCPSYEGNRRVRGRRAARSCRERLAFLNLLEESGVLESRMKTGMDYGRTNADEM